VGSGLHFLFINIIIYNEFMNIFLNLPITVCVWAMLPCVAPAARQYLLHAVIGWLTIVVISNKINLYFENFKL
jgi:hypothetical protein